MIPYPYIPAQDIEELFLKRAASLRTDINRVFPGWMNEAPADLLRNRKFIVCGSTCRSEIRVLARHAEVIAIVDDALSKQRGNLFGIPVIDSDTWIERAHGDAGIVSCVLVAHGRATQYFVRQCLQWELSYLDPLQFLQLVKSCNLDARGETGRFFWYGYEFFAHAMENAERLAKLAGRFEDQFSRFSWFSVLMYRLTLNPLFLETCAVGHGYEAHGLNSYAFNRQFVKLSDDETYVDGGAFTGDTIELFMRAVNGKFRRIYSFEPSAANNREIAARLRRLQDDYLEPLAPRVTLVEKGMWDRETVLRFNPNRTVGEADLGTPAGAVAAHLVEAGLLSHVYDEALEDSVAIKVPVTTIDDATNAEATFIKLEIEGAELQALNGARRTIERNRPQMAVSVYHKPEDLLTLMDFIEDTGQNYKLGFRAHNPMAPDAIVVYCS